MALLNILHFPDPRLRSVAQPIKTVDSKIRRLIDDMLETMYEAPGVGLAAVQVNVAKQLVVIDVSEEKNSPMVFINPEIIERHGEEVMEEGCLSVPGIYEDVKRAERVTVKAINREGEPFELECDDLLAICIQHELDHLQGILFVDYLSEMKRQRIKRKMEKTARQTL